jgi:AraC family transcriptional regulator, transcriptional activator of pobA
MGPDMDQLFKIFQLTPADAEKINAAPDDPHRHDFEELIIGLEGKLEHFVDFRSTVIAAPFVCFVSKGKVHRVLPIALNGGFDAIVIRFKSEFIPETTFQLYSWYHDQANILLEPGPRFERIVTLGNLMSQEAQQEEPDYAVIRQLLSALFTMIESERRKTETGLYKTKNDTFSQFLDLLEANYHRPDGVEFYADKLFMSARNLNLICQAVLEQSVTEIIETRKLIEAKNLLIRTDKTISQIGFELGYKEKAHFTNVFKKRAGQTPTEFREEMKKLLS